MFEKCCHPPRKFWGLKNLDFLNIGVGKAEQDLRPAAYVPEDVQIIFEKVSKESKHAQKSTKFIVKM